MKLRLSEQWLSYALLCATLATLLWIGPGRILNHRLDYGHPYGYLAADTFQHQARADGILRIGHFRHEPIQHFIGIYPDFPGYYPPVFLQVAASWAGLSGLPTYVTAQGLAFLSSLMVAALLFFTFRKINPYAAVLALPLFPFSFLVQAASNAYTWGHWPQIAGQVTLVLLAWLSSQRRTIAWWALLVVALMGTFMTYIAYFAFAALFLILFAAGSWLSDRSNWSLLLGIAAAGAAALALSFRTLLIFLNVWYPTQGQFSPVLTEWAAGGGYLQLRDFGLFLIPLLAGLALAGYLLIKMLSRHEDEPRWPVVLFAFIMLAMGFTNYTGLDKRAFFIRLLWPYYLAVFVGLALWFALRGMFKTKIVVGAGTVAISAALLLGILLTAPPPVAGEGIASQPFWDLISWLRDTTPQDARIIFMYGDEFIGDNLWNVHRYHLRVLPEDYIRALQTMSVKREYFTTINSDVVPFTIIPPDHAKQNWLWWGWTANDTEPLDFYLHRERDICEMDYLVFATTSRQPILVQYNLYIASKLLEHPWMNVTFQNDYGIVLRNRKPGEACIEPHSLRPSA